MEIFNTVQTTCVHAAFKFMLLGCLFTVCFFFAWRVEGGGGSETSCAKTLSLLVSVKE